MNIRLPFLFSVVLYFVPLGLSPKFSMPGIFGDNMVLQRHSKVALYGTANPGERVNIEVSWERRPIRVNASSSGKWRANINTGKEATNQTIEVSTKESLRFENVCLGEVWVCSGQSNMARLLSGRSRSPIENGFSVIKEANLPNIRLYTLPQVSKKTPQFDNPSKWLVGNHETAAKFSAVGYVFGKELHEYLNVPVGLILNAWGGSPVEAWISKEKLKELRKTEDNNYYMKQSADIYFDSRPQHEPAGLFNGMIQPLIPYGIRGAIWYQGEANTVNAGDYEELFAAMIADWRGRWDLGKFPFYYVQIAPYDYPPGRTNSALVREAQANIQFTVPNTAMAVTLDIGEEKDIHPKAKIPVGERLAILALANTYGIKGFPRGCPTFQAMEVERNRIRIRFENTGNGLYIDGDNVNKLMIAGGDRVFYPAKGEVTPRGELLVSSEEVFNPVAVRYGFEDWVDGNLFSINGLPISSFRTDDWDQ